MEHLQSNELFLNLKSVVYMMSYIYDLMFLSHHDPGEVVHVGGTGRVCQEVELHLIVSH